MTSIEHPEMSGKSNAPSKRRIVSAVGVVLGVLVLYLVFGRGEEAAMRPGTTFEALRGDLEITVVEGGSVEAKDSQELKSEVKGQTKILTIVEEGYAVTAQDVAEGKVLVELDSKELLDRQTEQELNYQNATASFTEAREQYDIQINQNQSDTKAAELESKFALMDLKKYLGEDVAIEIARLVEANVGGGASTALAAGSEVEEAPGDAEEMPAPAVSAQEDSPRPPRADVEIDFSKYATLESLGDGEARQKLRELQDSVVLAQEDVGLAESKLEGTERLFSKDFVTKIELDNDKLAVKRKGINKESAETERELFMKYEFPKQAEKLLSDYEESLRKLQRARKLSISKLAQAEAKLNSAEARFELQSRRRGELAEQVEKCIIRATQPGLIVYGSSRRNYWNDDRIEEGASVRERQVIITIPDTTQMIVDVKVHESAVKRVKKGQRARVRVDSFPDILLEGEVTKIGVLPDSQNRWMNPNLKVYSTTIEIEGEYDWLKPGMSAEGEIIIETIKDVIVVPLQAVTQEKEESVVYLAERGMERRVVEVGSFDTTFIEIRSGLEPGEVVALRSPRTLGGDDSDDAEEKASDEEKKSGEAE